MSDELRFCFKECCHFVNNRAVSGSEYESAVGRNQPILTVPGPVEILISCRKDSGHAKSAERSVGFYLGSGMRRAYGTLIPEGERPYVFDNSTGKFLRHASDIDLHKWRDAWNESVKSAGP
jgi:hypothetical protein